AASGSRCGGRVTGDRARGVGIRRGILLSPTRWGRIRGGRGARVLWGSGLSGCSRGFWVSDGTAARLPFVVRDGGGGNGSLVVTCFCGLALEACPGGRPQARGLHHKSPALARSLRRDVSSLFALAPVAGGLFW